RTGLDLDDVKQSLDAETWIGGKEAVELGWADSLLESDEVAEAPEAQNKSKLAARKMDVLLAKAGVPRSERRAMMQAIKSDTPSAVESGTPGAADHEAE